MVDTFYGFDGRDIPITDAQDPDKRAAYLARKVKDLIGDPEDPICFLHGPEDEDVSEYLHALVKASKHPVGCAGLLRSSCCKRDDIHFLLWKGWLHRQCLSESENLHQGAQ